MYIVSVKLNKPTLCNVQKYPTLRKTLLMCDVTICNKVFYLKLFVLQLEYIHARYIYVIFNVMVFILGNIHDWRRLFISQLTLKHVQFILPA